MKLKKIIVVTLISLLVFVFINTVVFSVDGKDEINNFFNSSTDSKLPDTVKSLGGTVITIFQVVATGVALIMLIVLAMKYMLSSPEDRATIKKHAVIYVVGAVCLFAATGILEIFEKFSANLNA